MKPLLIRAAALGNFREMCIELSVDPDMLIERAGLSVESLANSEGMIHHQAFVDLLEMAAEESCIPHFGLLLARRQSRNFLGLVWFAMSQAPTVKEAIRTLAKYHHLHNQGSEVKFRTEGDLAIWEYSSVTRGQKHSRQYIDLSMALGTHMVRYLSGSNIRAKRVFFTHSEPAQLKPFQQCFECPLHFNQEFNGAVFDAEQLNRPTKHHDSGLRSLLENQLSEANRQQDDNLQSVVKIAIKRTLSTDQCNLVSIASLLLMSTRTLQRQLKEEHSSFSMLYDEVRFDTAAEYLQDSRIPLKQLASALGYSDQTSFSRSFKRRAGLSPQQWRKREVN